MPNRQNLALAILSILLLPLFLFRGSRTGNISDTTPPVPLPPPNGYVQIEGSVKNRGIYPISDNQLTASAILLALPDCRMKMETERLISRRIARTGDLYRVNCKSSAASGEIDILSMSPATSMLMGIPFSINEASSEDFDRLPDIGPGTAARIIEYRQINGRFNFLEELMMVEGIGEKRFAKMKSYLKL